MRLESEPFAKGAMRICHRQVVLLSQNLVEEHLPETHLFRNEKLWVSCKSSLKPTSGTLGFLLVNLIQDVEVNPRLPTQSKDHLNPNWTWGDLGDIPRTECVDHSAFPRFRLQGN